MAEVTDYTVTTFIGVESAESLSKDMIRLGWQPLGGVSATRMKSETGWRLHYSQAWIKDNFSSRELLARLISELGWPARVADRLECANIVTLKDLVTKTPEQLREFLARPALHEVRRALRLLGLRLGMTITELERRSD